MCPRLFVNKVVKIQEVLEVEEHFPGLFDHEDEGEEDFDWELFNGFNYDALSEVYDIIRQDHSDIDVLREAVRNRDFALMFQILGDSCEVIEEYEEQKEAQLDDDVSMGEEEFLEETSDLPAIFKNDLLPSISPESELKLRPSEKWDSGNSDYRWLLYADPEVSADLPLGEMPHFMVFCRPQFQDDGEVLYTPRYRVDKIYYYSLPEYSCTIVN
ncbi:hypothetical protein DMENIID0001_154830 [Sergentomyia squamirostris]